MSLQLNGTEGVTYNDGTLQSSAPVGKNLIINGNMAIDQRNAGASVTPTNGAYTLDRFVTFLTAVSKFSIQQDAGAVTSPAGFTNYLGVTSLSSYAVGASDYFTIGQNIEGFNISDLAWGTADAKTVTLSFWVRSSLTGTFGGALVNSGNNRSYPFTYTISTANTWEQASITITGDTTGTWLTNNGIGIKLRFGLGAGATNSGTAGSWSGSTYFTATGATSVVGTSGATFYITGVQLEAGTTASDFENLQYGTQLSLCQRYYQQYGSAGITTPVAAGVWFSTTQVLAFFPFIMEMRTAPTMTVSGAGWGMLYRVGTSSLSTDSTPFDSITATSARINNSGVNVAGVAGQGCYVQLQTGYFAYLDAEL